MAVCIAFQAWISTPMPQIIPDFKSKTWETTDWQSAVYFMPGFQSPCLRSSLILNPRPGKPCNGSLHCISSLDFKSHASDHPRFQIQDLGNHRLAVCSVFHARILELMPQIILDFKSKTWETMQWQSAVYFMPGFQIPCLRSSPILNSRPGKPQIGSLQCISWLDLRAHASDHPQF